MLYNSMTNMFIFSHRTSNPHKSRINFILSWPKKFNDPQYLPSNQATRKIQGGFGAGEVLGYARMNLSQLQMIS